VARKAQKIFAYRQKIALLGSYLGNFVALPDNYVNDFLTKFIFSPLRKNKGGYLLTFFGIHS